MTSRRQKFENRGERLVMVVPAFPRLSESFIVNKFLGLLAQGWDVHVVCGRSEDSEWSRLASLGLQPAMRQRVHRSWPTDCKWLAAVLLPVAGWSCLWNNPRGTVLYFLRGWREFGLGVWQRFYFDATLISLKPDLVHFEFGALARKRTHLKPLLGCRLVASFRGYDLNYSGLEEPDAYREVWRAVDGVHCLGDDLWRRAVRRGCPPEKQRALVPPAVDTDFFDPRGRVHSEPTGTRARPLRILSVGRLEWVKGGEYGLEAVKLLQDLGMACEYRIVGAGSALAALAFARYQLGIEAEVQLLGARPREEVREQMRWADVFLHAAVCEGFGNVVLEAQAMQLPVVCSDAGGLPENVADAHTGFVVPRRSPPALAEKLATLARDPTLRHRMGQAGRQRVLERFQLASQIVAFDHLYRDVLTLGEDDRENASPGRAMAPTASGVERE